MKNIREFLKELTKAGVELKLEEGDLNLWSKSGTIDSLLFEKIKDNKSFIVKYLERFKKKDLINNVLPKLADIKYNQDRPERIPLSYGQERLWFLDQLHGSLEYHIPVVLKLKGTLEREILHSALKKIVSRHEVLRTVIYSEEGIGYQQVLEVDDWNLDYRDVVGEVSVLEDDISSYIAIPFDLSKDYMFRACLYDLGGSEYILAGVFHHISSDGWSNNILIKEFVEFYDAGQEGRVSSLAALPLQYADYAFWQRSYLEGDVLEEELSYWEAQLSEVPVLSLPTDYIRPAVKSYSGANLSINLGSDLSEGLLSLSHQEGSTLFMTLLAGFKILLSRYSGQTDIFCEYASFAK